LILLTNQPMKTTFTQKAILLFFLFLLLPISAQNKSARELILIDKDWRFSFGHLYDTKKDFGHAEGYFSYLTKTGFGDGPAASGFDDRAWRKLDLPHDWAVEQPFSESASFSHGFKAAGKNFPEKSIGWYRKKITIPNSDLGKIISLKFDGVFRNSKVFFNGFYLGTEQSGYNGFEYDVSAYVNYGGENTISVRVDASMEEGWFYEGAGIYRHVYLQKTNPIYVKTNGTFITSEIKGTNAEITAEVSIENKGNSKGDLEIIQTIFDASNKQISTNSEKNNTPEFYKTSKYISKLNVKNPLLWDVDNPNLYRLVTKIRQNGKVIDIYETSFGIRTIKFDPENGFFLNGKPLKLKGTNNHQDHAGIGTALPDEIQYYRIKKLKEMGSNAYRCSHHPPTPELLKACDELGMLVIDETRLMGINDYHLNDLKRMMERDRNHPSIFVWSIGNEIPEQWNEKGVEIAKELATITREYDKTRPLTAAMNPPVNMNIDEVTLQFEKKNVQFNAIAKSGVLDLIGYNYAHQTYEHHLKNFPNTPFIATETTSGLQTRGYYDAISDTIKKWPVSWDKKFDGGNPGNTVSAYDQVQTPWGSTHEATWKVIKKHDFLSGMYIWTGFDYIGEPTPYEWPSVSSYFGIVDLAGFPKDVYYMYQSEWTDKTVLHIFPHWNWKAEQTVDVWAYYNKADEVELFVNGKSVGKRSKKGEDLHVMWRIPFEAGTLKAISRKGGKVVLEKEIKTAGNPSQLILTADRSTIKADKNDLSFVTVDILDDKGTLAPNANNEINFSLKGNGKIVGVCSGDPVSHESYKGNKHTALAGKCLVIVQSGDKSGRLELTASANGLKQSTIVITTE